MTPATDPVLLPFREESINGKTYRVTRLKFGRWLDLCDLVAAMLGQTVADALSGRVVLDINALLDAEIALQLAGTALKSVNKQTLTRLMGFVGEVTSSDYAGEMSPITAQKADIYWPNHIADLGPVVKLFFEVQFADFFDGLRVSMPAPKSAQEGHLQKTGQNQG